VTLGWPARLYEHALAAGYVFSVPRIGSALKPLVGKFGEEEVERVWQYWITNVVDMGEDTRYITPNSFARTYGHWRRMSSPVEF